MIRWVGTVFVLGGLASGCVRSVDLPEQLEGVTITGQLVAKNVSTGDWRGLEGASVSVRGSTFRATTNASGAFKLDRLPLNIPLSLDFSGPREMGMPARGRSLDPIVGLVDGQAISLGAIRLSPGGDIEGRVLLGDASEPALEAGGTLVVAVGTSFRAITDDEGGFKLRDAAEGSFDLAVFRSGFRSARIEGVQVTPASTTTLKEVRLMPGEDGAIMIGGSARRADVSTETGHFGISVVFTGEPNQPGVAPTTETVVTDDNGDYALPLPAGIYRLVASEPALNSVTVTGIAVLAEGVLGLPALSLSTKVEGDFDNDGVQDSEDDDDDNDGCQDIVDAFPLDPAYCFDSDMDGIPNASDPDDDNDGLTDAEEASEGLDGWITNPLSDDSDRDGVKDPDDVCPTIPDDQSDANGNGVGDACEDTGPGTMNPAPRISGFTPARAGAGDTVTISGANLASSTYPTVVQFGLPSLTGIPVAPFESGPGLLRVTVPEGAQTGFIRVYAGGRTTTSTRTFTYQPGPNIVDISPRAGRIGSRVRIIGQDLNSAGLLASINGEPATILDQPSEVGPIQVYPIVLQGTLYDAMDIVVPDIESGPITVRTDFGVGTSPSAFEVEDSGIVVTALSPAVVPVGVTLRIRGHGFSVSDIVNSAPVQVIFNYDSAPISQDVLPGTVDSQILVSVPAGAVSGRIAVNHPSLSQPAVSPIALTIDPRAPVVNRASDTVIRVGDSLSLYGANLGNATSVAFSGGAVVTALVPQGTAEVRLTVPANVDPGPITVVTPTGTATSAIEFSVVEVSSSLAFPTPPMTGGGPIVGDQEVALLSGNAQSGYIVNVSGPTPVLGTEIDLSIVNGGVVNPLSFDVDPTGQYGVLLLTSSVRVFQLPGFNVVGDCPLAGGTAPNSRIRTTFDPVLGVAYAPKLSSSPTADDAGFIRIDLATATCDLMDLGFAGPGWGWQSRMLAQANRQLLVTNPRLGSALVDVDPVSQNFGQIITPWHGPLFQPAQLQSALNGDVLVIGAGGPVNHYTPFVSQTLERVIGVTAQYISLDGTGRFMLALMNGQSVIVDTAASPPTVVRRMLDVQPRIGSGLRNATKWLVSSASELNLVKVEIRAP